MFDDVCLRECVCAFHNHHSEVLGEEVSFFEVCNRRRIVYQVACLWLCLIEGLRHGNDANAATSSPSRDRESSMRGDGVGALACVEVHGSSPASDRRSIRSEEA